MHMPGIFDLNSEQTAEGVPAALVRTPLVRKMYRLSSVIQLVNDQMTFVSANDLAATDRCYDYLVATWWRDLWASAKANAKTAA